MTDALKVIAENTAHMAGGSVLNTRFYDIINPVKDTRTAEEVISHIKEKLMNI